MMGVLKVVLAVLGAVQIIVGFLYADIGFQDQQLKLLFGTEDAVSPSSKVLMELLCPLYLGMASVNLFSWKMGSDMRPKVAVANMVTLIGVGFVHYRHSSSFPSNTAPVWMSVLGVLAVGVGLVLHQMEPGLLTEDKKAAATKARAKKSH